MKPPLAAFTLLALPRMEQVESSWTGERRSPAPGENMAAPLPTGERGLQALQSGPGLVVHGVPSLADPRPTSAPSCLSPVPLSSSAKSLWRAGLWLAPASTQASSLLPRIFPALFSS